MLTIDAFKLPEALPFTCNWALSLDKVIVRAFHLILPDMGTGEPASVTLVSVQDCPSCTCAVVPSTFILNAQENPSTLSLTSMTSELIFVICASPVVVIIWLLATPQVSVERELLGFQVQSPTNASVSGGALEQAHTMAVSKANPIV